MGDALTKTSKLEFPGVPVKSTATRELWFTGFHLETISAALKLPQKLEEVVILFLPQDSNQISRQYRRTEPWPEITEDMVTEAFGHIGKSLQHCSFAHKHMGAYPWGRVLTGPMVQFAIAAYNLFPPGPRNWRDWRLSDLIPKNLKTLIITHCDFSQEREGDVNEQDPSIDYSKVVYHIRSIARLAHLLGNEQHSLKQVVVVHLGPTERITGQKFGDWTDPFEERDLPPVSNIILAFTLQFLQVKVRFMAQGMSRFYDF